jgi:hypothetical protein
MSIYVEVAISLVLVFLVLSLVVTAVNELIAIQRKKRPRMLLQTIVQLLDNDELRTRFYANGFIANAREAARAGVSGPHPARTNVVNNRFPAAEAAAAEYREGHASYISGANFAKAVSMALADMGPAGADDVFAKVSAAVGNLPDSRIKDVLGKAVEASGQSLTRFEAAVASWFDSTQDRVTGAYARYQKYLALGVAAVLAVALNVDAVRLAQELQVNEALRLQLVEQADGAVKAGTSLCDGKAGEERETCLVDAIRDQFAGISPALFGWSGDPLFEDVARVKLWGAASAAEGGPAAMPSASGWDLAGGAVSKLVGLLITICAVSLGAPFWFDTLSKFVNIRGAGAKPVEKPQG